MTLTYQVWVKDLYKKNRNVVLFIRHWFLKKHAPYEPVHIVDCQKVMWDW